jgi:organic hydroperoxide reductase OsmC/OhrA
VKSVKKHYYKSNLEWTGNSGSGTLDYKSYERSYVVKIEGKSILEGSSDPAFRGDKSKYNPEELFLASISSCHMLWYLHLCSANNIVVLEYEDAAEGIMTEDKNGSGKFERVTLHPKVVVEKESMMEQARSLHKQANEMCFIANSCNFEIEHEVDVKALRTLS